MLEKIFLLPEREGDLLAGIIDVIPDDWASVSGHLEPADYAVDPDRVVCDTGYACQRLGSMPEIVGRRPGPPNCSDVVAILVDGKLPGWVTFNEVGPHPSQGTTFNDLPKGVTFDEANFSLGKLSTGPGSRFALARRIAAGFVRRGYRGWLAFSSAGCAPAANLMLHLKPWHRWEGFGKPRRLMPATAWLSWSAVDAAPSVVERACATVGTPLSSWSELPDLVEREFVDPQGARGAMGIAMPARCAVTVGVEAERSVVASSAMVISRALDGDPFYVKLDGQWDHKDPDIRYLGVATRQSNGEYHVLANVHGRLCLVAVRISFQESPKPEILQ